MPEQAGHLHEREVRAQLHGVERRRGVRHAATLRSCFSFEAFASNSQHCYGSDVLQVRSTGQPEMRPVMKAVRFHQYGDPDVLRYEEVANPAPGTGQVRVRVAGTTFNGVDGNIRAGYMQD